MTFVNITETSLNSKENNDNVFNINHDNNNDDDDE